MLGCPWEESAEGMHILYGNQDDQFRIQYIPEVVYSVKDGKSLHLQILVMRQPLPGKRYPAVLYVVGSGWRTQDRFEKLPQLVDLARQGYVVAAMEYRNTDDGYKFPCQVEDAKSAIRYLRAHADDFQIDTARIAIWGDSSGAHTALLAGFTEESQFSSPGDPNETAKVNGIVDFYGPVDFSIMDQWPREFPTTFGTWGNGEALRLLFGGAKKRSIQVMEKASPLSYIVEGKTLPPVLIMHGDKDPVIHLHHSILLYERLRMTGHQVELFVVRNAAHGFQFWTQQTMDVVNAFFRAYL